MTAHRTGNTTIRRVWSCGITSYAEIDDTGCVISELFYCHVGEVPLGPFSSLGAAFGAMQEILFHIHREEQYQIKMDSEKMSQSHVKIRIVPGEQGLPRETYTLDVQGEPSQKFDNLLDAYDAARKSLEKELEQYGPYDGR